MAACLPESDLRILSCFLKQCNVSRIEDPLDRNCFWIVSKFYDFKILTIRITKKSHRPYLAYPDKDVIIDAKDHPVCKIIFTAVKSRVGYFLFPVISNASTACPDRYLLSLLPGHSATALISVQEPRQIEQTQEGEKLNPANEQENRLGPPPPRLSFATLVKSMTQLKTAKMRKNSTILRAQQRQGRDEEQPDLEDPPDLCHFNKSENDQEEN